MHVRSFRGGIILLGKGEGDVKKGGGRGGGGHVRSVRRNSGEEGQRPDRSVGGMYACPVFPRMLAQAVRGDGG